MRVFVIDASNMASELQGGLIGVVGSPSPSPEEKLECVEAVSQYVVEGWAIAADPLSPLGRLAALTAEAACVPFVNLCELRNLRDLLVSGPAENRLIDAGGVGHGID
ncbi:hypothetical protein ACRAWC_15825 [Leifsonia sp. L25]|uniref:hypothetical protein n=1 Tax=Actinomycetes TaxID=1760 RepID=UPI003D6945C8